jgi:hypothetical protein
MYPPVHQLGTPAQRAAEQRRMELWWAKRERRRGSGSRRFWIFAIVACVTASVEIAVASASPAPPTRADSTCTPGARTIGGARAQVFCGSATATAHIAGRTFRFVSGSCELASGFALNIGTLAGGSPESRPYLGLDVMGHGAGRHENGTAVVSFHVRGRRFSISLSRSTVVLDSGLDAGTFSGLDQLGRSVRGTFSC